MTEARTQISGIGVVHALGIGVKEFWANLLSGNCSFSEVSESRRGHSASKIGAELHNFSLSCVLKRGKALDRLWPRPVQLGLAATIMALNDSGLNILASRERIGLIVGTSVGNLTSAFEFRDGWIRTGRTPAHTAFYSFHHSIASVISAELDLRGPSYTISQGCSSGLDATGLANVLILSGACDIVLVVGTDNELTPEVYAALEASNSLSTAYNDAPQGGLRPFDANRGGNVLGEGACAYVVECSRHVATRKGRSYASISGVGLSAAGGGRQYDSGDPQLETATFKRAMRSALDLGADEHITSPLAICANGSGSKIYDRLEANALAELIDREAEHQIFSIKGSVGQHGAPSAAMQVASSALTLWTSTIPPTLNCENPIPEVRELNIVSRASAIASDRILCNSIGLGGFFYSSLLLKKSNLPHFPLTNVVWGDMRLEVAENLPVRL